MGCCFSVEEDERDPLLGGQTRVRTDPLPRSTDRGGSRSEKTATSARRFRPPEKIGLDRRGLQPIVIKPVRIPSVDKRLQDHADLFNMQVQRWFDLCSTSGGLRSMFPEGNPGENLHDLFYHISKVISAEEGAMETVSVKRRFQYCMEIEYDEHLIPSNVTPVFLAFNKANKLVREILDKGSPLANSVALVVQDEKDLRREVLVASLGSDGPDSMKNCMDNITELRRVPGVVEDIKRNTIRLFEEMKAAVGPLTASVNA